MSFPHGQDPLDGLGPGGQEHTRNGQAEHEDAVEDPTYPLRGKRRVKVVLAERRGARRILRPMAQLEGQDTPIAESVVKELVRRQLKIAISLAGLVLALYAGLPVLFVMVPEIGEAVIFGIRLPWLLVGGLAYPFMVVVGMFFNRAVERNEAKFANQYTGMVED
ncbi:hypothetical protein [Allokutzneria sp. NRRL B-24872]|uniref:hypothetical protein n=1 Tax=Allokutzneria sp. NRRL B-24872 TaxID=1137961 RepID=UPI000A387019|nr:hypothetical protein [Allokutzneria sp. NRRL B-24872]